MTDDPCRQCDDLTIEFVDAAAGAGKTLTAIAVALDRARHGVKTIFVMPTIELIHEMASFALRPGDVPIVEITSANDEHGFKRHPPITELIRPSFVSRRNENTYRRRVLQGSHDIIQETVEFPETRRQRP
jgi:replicative superfamily II helicase